MKGFSNSKENITIGVLIKCCKVSKLSGASSLSFTRTSASVCNKCFTLPTSARVTQDNVRGGREHEENNGLNHNK